MDDDLENRLSSCSKSDKTFLEQPQYLERLEVAGVQYMGRRLEGDGIVESNVEDSARNVASLIKRVAPGWNKSPFNAVLTAVEENIEHSGVEVHF